MSTKVVLEDHGSPHALKTKSSPVNSRHAIAGRHASRHVGPCLVMSHHLVLPRAMAHLFAVLSVRRTSEPDVNLLQSTPFWSTPRDFYQSYSGSSIAEHAWPSNLGSPIWDGGMRGAFKLINSFLTEQLDYSFID